MKYIVYCALFDVPKNTVESGKIINNGPTVCVALVMKGMMSERRGVQAEIMDVEVVPVLKFILSHPTTLSHPNQLNMNRFQPFALISLTLFALTLVGKCCLGNTGVRSIQIRCSIRDKIFFSAGNEPCVIKYRMCRGNVNGYSEFLERYYNISSATDCHVNCQTIFPEKAAYYQFFEGPKRNICACLSSCIVANYKIMGLEIGSINGRDPNNICP